MVTPFEEASFYNTEMDPKYYSMQRNLELELALIELRDMLANGYDGSKPTRYIRLQTITAHFGLPEMDCVTIETNPTKMVRRIQQSSTGRITVNATKTDVS